MKWNYPAPRAAELPQIYRLPELGILETHFSRAKAQWFNRDYPQALIDLGCSLLVAKVMLTQAVLEWR